MKTTTRNWSSVRDYLGDNFGLRAFYTREQWIQQVNEWQKTNPALDDLEYDVFKSSIDSMTDEDLIGYISENWEIMIRETTWLRVGAKCWCRWHDDGVVMKIVDIPLNSDGELTENADILVEYNGIIGLVPLSHLYGLTEETCPRCGSHLYVSDLCDYPYVCLKCDENFF